jgi:hypothetical protein
MSTGRQVRAALRQQNPLPTTEADKTGTGNATVTFSTPVTAIDAYNAHATDNMTLTVNGVSRIVPPGGRLCRWAEPFTTVTVTATGAWVLTGQA